MFLIYINGFPNSSTKINQFIYADNSILLHKGLNVDIEIQDRTNKSPKMKSRFHINKHRLNVNKSTFLTFRTNLKQCTQNNHIVIDNTKVHKFNANNFMAYCLLNAYMVTPHSI